LLTYVHTLKRIRSDKTNYRKRAALLIGRHSFVTIKVSDQNIAAQMIKPAPSGDVVLASAHSSELAKQGWKGAANNLPACYLTGLLLGKKALAKDIKNAVLYIGKDHFTSRVASCLKGIVDSGVAMPVSEESLPDDERISGQHIAQYAETLKENQEEFASRFSALLKNGLNPQDYPLHFEEIRSKISGKPAAVAKKKSEEKEGESTSTGTKEKKAVKEKKEKISGKEAKEEKRKEKKKSEDKGGKSKNK
jgi:large subunit ribosomal protein L18